MNVDAVPSSIFPIFKSHREVPLLNAMTVTGLEICERECQGWIRDVRSALQQRILNVMWMGTCAVSMVAYTFL